VRCDPHGVPLARGPRDDLARGPDVIDCATLAVPGPVGRLVDLDLDRGVDPVRQLPAADEDPAVGPGGHLELQIQDEVPVLIPGPEIPPAQALQHALHVPPTAGLERRVGQIVREERLPTRGMKPAGRLVEEGRAPGDLAHVVLPVGLVLNGKDPPEPLPVQLSQGLGGPVDPRAPDHVPGLVPGPVEVLEVDGPDAALQLLQAGHGIQAGPDPMARVRARPDPCAATLARGQDDVGVPVVRGPGVVVDADADPVLLTEPVEHRHRGLVRLCLDRLDPHLLGERKHLAAALLVLGQVRHAEVDQLHTV